MITTARRVLRFAVAVALVVGLFITGGGPAGPVAAAYGYDTSATIAVGTLKPPSAATTPPASSRTVAPPLRSSPRASPGVVRLVSGCCRAAKGRTGADNVANGPRLADDLTRREAAAVFDDAGRLHPDAVANSQLIIPGSKLNPGLARELTKDGSRIADWGKYTTQRFRSPSGPFEVHFYRNRATGKINYDFDYKAKLGGRAP
jgi:hypothetical protein